MAEQTDRNRVHSLKTHPEVFWATWHGKKRAEFRKDDRGFQEGDQLFLEEWVPETRTYSGRMIKVEVTHIVRGPAFGIPEGYVMMSVEVKSSWPGRVMV